MLRNIIISILAAVLIVEKVPWFRYCAMEEKIGVFIGFFIALIIFCFFCEKQVEKYRKYRERVLKIQRNIERLRNGKSREIAGNNWKIRRESGYALSDEQ